MTLTVLFAAGRDRWSDWQDPLTRELDATGVKARVVLEAEPEAVDAMIVAPGPELPADFGPFTRCRLVQNLWAGVERIAPNPTLTQPLCRMVDPGLTQGMIDYVAAHVLRAHVLLDDVLAAQDGAWRPVMPPLASERPVAMLGLGELGTACGQALSSLGFPVLGWSRTPREVPGIAGHHGREGLRTVLSRAQIVVTLLPATQETENTLNAETLGWLPKGATLINPGRGTLIDDDALLAALDSGQVAQATLDVFRTEPLPASHPYWAHPRVTVTPHVAAETRPSSASVVVAENLRRLAAGEPLLHRVDRQAGY